MVGVIDINHLEYHIQIYSDLKGKIKDMVCDCGHSAKDNPCAHIGALLLKLNEVRINTFPYHYQRLKQTSSQNDF